MKYTINAINQLGIFESGLTDQTDIIDWALLDYVFDWQQNPLAQTLNGMIWINYKHLINEMPLLGIKDKSAISRRITKLKNLGLIVTLINLEESKLYAKTTEKYYEITRFKASPTPVVLEQPPLIQNNAPVVLEQPPIVLEQRPVVLKQPISNTNNSNTNNSNTNEQISDFSIAAKSTAKKHLIDATWTPSERCKELLSNAGIAESFYRPLVDEFIFYWQERHEKRAGWDSTFLNHAKRQWQLNPVRYNGTSQKTASSIQASLDWLSENSHD